MDTRNDGRDRTFKAVLSLRNVTKTGPWTWHGWQKEIDLAMRKSLTDSMLGKEPTADELKAIVAYLDTLKPPPNPHRPNGEMTAEAKRGEAVFRSEKADCVRCHSGPYFTDGKIHDVGLGSPGDAYKGYNPPSLVGCYDRVLYLHDGRAKSLEQALTGPHAPEKVTGQGKLTPDELRDLIAYLKSL
jgi:cytochrome c peroxidase